MSAPIERVLERLEGVRQSPRGQMARCPHHRDRSPSLSISVGRDGAVLLRCFAGCSVESICAAIGLGVRDLFASQDARDRENAQRVELRARYRSAPRATITAYLEREIGRQGVMRVEREPFDTARVRSADVNHARRRAAVIFEVRLDPISRYDWEGWHPNDTDPAWPELFARACDEIAWNYAAFVDPAAPIAAAQELPRRFHFLAADLAGSWLRALSREKPLAADRGERVA